MYNKTVSCINNYDKEVKNNVNFIEFRGKLATENTKKSNIEYVTLRNNMKLYGDEKKLKQKNLTKVLKK